MVTLKVVSNDDEDRVLLVRTTYEDAEKASKIAQEVIDSLEIPVSDCVDKVKKLFSDNGIDDFELCMRLA